MVDGGLVPAGLTLTLSSPLFLWDMGMPSELPLVPVLVAAVSLPRPDLMVDWLVSALALSESAGDCTGSV